MKLFDHIDPSALDRREWDLWLLMTAMILVLAAGVALLMYPLIYSRPIFLAPSTMEKVFFSFCVMSILFVSYLMNRRAVIRRLRNQVREEQRRNIRLRHQASADLLDSLPRLEHFQDRLAMEFRRAANTQQSFSLLMVRLKPSGQLVDDTEICTAFGDAAKALFRRLRGEDSLHLFRRGVFGIVLPAANDADANKIFERLAEALADASGADNRFSSDLRVINYPVDAESAKEMEQLARSFAEDRPTPSVAA